MKKQLLTLQQLLAVMDPQLYRHLGETLSALTLQDVHITLARKCRRA
jgi:hypothetical protein